MSVQQNAHIRTRQRASQYWLGPFGRYSVANVNGIVLRARKAIWVDLYLLGLFLQKVKQMPFYFWMGVVFLCL